MIAKEFDPVQGIKSFTIMTNLAVTPISAISEEPGSREAAGGTSRRARCGAAHHVSLLSQRP